MPGPDSRNGRISAAVRFAACLLALCVPVSAYETDQISNRLEPVRDSTAVLNREVNLALQSIADDWRGPRNDKRFVRKVYRKIGGIHWVDKLERWAMKSDEVDKLATPRYASIYSGHPITATRVTRLFGIGATIKVNGHLIGSDKIGHFLSQGKKFYFRWLRSGSEADAAKRSAFTERAIFGQKTTGSYSNADLVANYEGHRFYRSLFEDGIVAEKKAILRWQDGRYRIQRPFDFADHINAYWDEGLHINHYDRLLYPHMQRRLKSFCGDFEKNPRLYGIENEDALIRKYRHLQLRDTTELRLDHLCR